MLKINKAQIQKNFNIVKDKLACKCCGRFTITPEVIDFYLMVQELRDWAREAFHVNSGERCEKHNKNVGGSPKSQHLHGRALDIRDLKKYTKEEIKTKWFEICDKYGYAGGFGFYNGRFHIDNRNGKRSLWDFR